LATHPIAEYKAARDLEIMHDTQIIGHQPGDPENAAAAFIQVAESNERPLHLFLGSDAFGMAKAQMESILRDLNAYEVLSKSTDFKK
jgi:hypothetical protein